MSRFEDHRLFVTAFLCVFGSCISIIQEKIYGVRDHGLEWRDRDGNAKEKGQRLT